MRHLCVYKKFAQQLLILPPVLVVDKLREEAEGLIEYEMAVETQPNIISMLSSLRKKCIVGLSKPSYTGGLLFLTRMLNYFL
jgi:hypothetical protein